MKTLLAVLIGASLMAGLSTRSFAAVGQPTEPANATIVVAAADYDSPAFGTRQWWDREADRG